MQIAFACPACQAPVRAPLTAAGDPVECGHCRWNKSVAEGDVENGRPVRCALCGCDDLWRQKDFPPQLGLAMVGAGALLSTLAWANYQPVLAIGILMAFALIDLLLYALMSDVLVCYRCEARYRQANLDADDHPRFSLETAERYRQESLRLQEASSVKPSLK